VRGSHGHGARRWTLTELAAQVHLDPSYLVRLFKASTGLPPMAYLAQLRAEHAAALLLHTDQPITSISQAVGWPDQNYFARRFKAHYGLSATIYRARFAAGAFRLGVQEQSGAMPISGRWRQRVTRTGVMMRQPLRWDVRLERPLPTAGMTPSTSTMVAPVFLQASSPLSCGRSCLPAVPGPGYRGSRRVPRLLWEREAARPLRPAGRSAGRRRRRQCGSCASAMHNPRRGLRHPAGVTWRRDRRAGTPGPSSSAR
jgi:AraC-like DNA-binding protein